jgi:hypothetical protein
MVHRDTDASAYMCSNVLCKRAFKKPLKTLSIGVSDEPYDACPFCLTSVTTSSQIQGQGTDQQKHRPELISPSTACKNHLGYLAKRAPKQQIPEECLTCSEIVHCMLNV